MAVSLLLGLPALNLQPAPHRVVGSAPHRARCVRMGLFDGLAAAFENDDTLGERQDAGLKSKLKTSTVTWMGPKPEGPMAAFTKQTIIEQTARPGQTLKELSEEAGVPVRYSCMGGTCRICDVTINGVVTPACMNKIERNGGDLVIEYREANEAEQYAREALKAERAAKKAAREAAKAGLPAPAPAPPPAPVAAATPFGELPKLELPNPFDGAVKPTNPFGGFKPPANPVAAAEEESRRRAAAPDDEDDDEAPKAESNLELIRRLRMEEQIAKENAANSKGGWPF